MLQHLLTLIWNKKRQHFPLFLELFVSFMVLFAVFTMLVYNYENKSRPRGFQYENILTVTASVRFREGAPKDSVTLVAQQLKRTLLGIPGVAGVSYASNNSPYTMNNWNSNVSYEKASTMANVYSADDDYPAVMQTQMARGRWFGREDDAVATPSAVINEALAGRLFGAEDPIGKIANLEGKKRVIGVMKNMKDKGDFEEMQPGFFYRADSGYHERLLIRLSPGAPPSTESRIYKTFIRQFPQGTTEIERLPEKRVAKNRMALVPLIVMLVISGFLVLNVALGIYGVVWYSVNKRRAEIGLRKAVGATSGAITRQIVGEAIVLTSLPLLLGIILAVQFPLLQLFDLPASTYVVAILLSVAFLYLLVTGCALYPGRQAANIYPAVALHED